MARWYQFGRLAFTPECQRFHRDPDLPLIDDGKSALIAAYPLNDDPIAFSQRHDSSYDFGFHTGTFKEVLRPQDLKGCATCQDTRHDFEAIA